MNKQQEYQRDQGRSVCGAEMMGSMSRERSRERRKEQSMGFVWGSINPKGWSWLLLSLQCLRRGAEGFLGFLRPLLKQSGYEEALVLLALQVSGGSYLHKLN